jgi:hypothetical protein
VNLLTSALQRVGSHDPLCSIYGTDAERVALAVPFLGIGLARGEKCVYVHDHGGGNAVASALAAQGANVERLVAQGALAFTTCDGAQLGWRFAPEQTLSFWQREAAAAKRQGYRGVRCAADVACGAGELPGLGRWLEYEARLTELLGQSDFHEGVLCRNPYFAPLCELGIPAGDDGAVRRWLHSIGHSERLELRIRQGTDVLARKHKVLAVAHRRLAAEHEMMARFHQLSLRLVSQSDVQKTLGTQGVFTSRTCKPRARRRRCASSARSPASAPCTRRRCSASGAGGWARSPLASARRGDPASGSCACSISTRDRRRRS